MGKTTLENNIANKNNSLNTIKLMAALMVMVGHAYAFSNNYEKYDFLYTITSGKLDLGALAVYIFFFYSGLLIARSISNGPTLKEYAFRRIRRIYPAFILVTVLIVFVIAPIITNIHIKDYFTNPYTYRYLLNLICINVHNLPGVFVNNAYGLAVNGPIWTIRLEIICYIACFIYYKIGLMKNKYMPISVIVFTGIVSMLAWASYRINGSIYSVIMPVTMFYIGIIYAEFRDRIIINKKMLIASVLLFIIVTILKYPVFACVTFLPYILCGIGFIPVEKPSVFDLLGRASYEIYLWGGFIGQLVSYAFGGSVSLYLSMIITIPVTLILGYITYRVVD